MAKARKPKSADDSKQDNSTAIVRHQKLCLSIDLDTRRIYGYTELEIAVPDIGIVGLHAENLGISGVLVDGEPTEYEYYPLHQNAENGRIWSSVTSSNSAADVASSLYFSALEKELETNLLINCCKPFKAGNELQESTVLENGSQSFGEAKQNVKLVRIDYWVEKAESGVHFDGNVLHTDNQMRRARCWFPCMDVNSQRCCYDLEFTVAQNLVAVSSGNLLYQVLSKDDPPRKTYVYKIDFPVSASWIALAVAPFQILPDSQNALLSHMCLPPNIMKLQNTVGFFYTAFSYYEDYLGAKFPFGSYKQVFIAPEMAVSSLSLGVSVSIFSSQMLYDEKVIDKTIDTRIKLALALAKQWFGAFITAASPDDEWLLDGLASYLTDSFIKKQLGNNEARYRRFKANCAVCRADDSGATTLSCSASCKDLYGTQSIGLNGKIRSWKSVAILQMLEKQVGPETFCKILQTIVSRGLDTTHPSTTLSTKEFRHLANKVGTQGRSFFKEFFSRWVESCGCPVLRIGFSYNKRKNIAEVAVLRGCTARQEADAYNNASTDSEVQQTDVEWPGMMSIRVNELDDMSKQHSSIPLAGESLQLVEIQCQSKPSARRFQKSKKGPKADGSDDNGDAAVETRPSSESPLLWVRADPEMEYLAEIHLHQPVQMWINQLEKDKDVVAQAQAISILEVLPLVPFSVVNALNNFLSDSKAFWRVRIEAAFALANIASEETDSAGLVHLLKFYRNRRFDAEIGLPKPNDFRDIPEHFVLEAIPRAVAVVRAADGKSPREAVEFVLQLLKYNDNNGNAYSDVFWLATLIESVGELEFGQQTVVFLPSLLKRIDRILQFDRLMPSYNGTLTISCIRTLSRLALKLSDFIPLDRFIELITPFRDLKTIWLVRIEATRALLDLEFQYRGLDAALSLFIKYLDEEPSLRGQVKLSVHVMRLCQISGPSSDIENDLLRNTNLVALLRLLQGRLAFNNIYLRHYLFCILQILAGRAPTLYGAPRDKTLPVGDAENGIEQKNIFRDFISESKPPLIVERKLPEAPSPVDTITTLPEPSFPEPSLPKPPSIPEPSFFPEPSFVEAPPNPEVPSVPLPQGGAIPEVVITTKDADTVSSSHEQKRSIVKIKVKRSTPSTDNQTVEKSLGGGINEGDRGASSSVSVDAPQRNNLVETTTATTVNLDEVNSSHDPGWAGSRGTGSIGSDNLGRELQCTADSSKASIQSQSMNNNNNNNNIEGSSMATTDVMEYGPSCVVESKGKDEKKKDRKRRREDPEYMEKKRLKKEKKKREKELGKLKNAMEVKEEGVTVKAAAGAASEVVVSGGSNVVITKVEAVPRPEGSSAPPSRFKIKIKNRTLSKS